MAKRFISPETFVFPAFVFFLFTSSISTQGAAPVPSVTGPIKVTEKSYPFGSAAKTIVPQDLSKFGYVEEEYFVSGKANVYGFGSAGKVVVRTPDAPYTTRILVRRPVVIGRFSGNVVVEPLNSALQYDWDPQWMFSGGYFIAHRDIWVGITIKPGAAKSLKKFDSDRYAALAWANPVPPNKTCPKSALRFPDQSPETEEGLAWDIMSQVAALIRSPEKRNPLTGFKVEHVYATGYSMTGMYLKTYINFIRPLATAKLDNGKPLYDGYLIGDGDGVALPLSQCEQAFPPGVSAVIIGPRTEPVISIVTEGSVLEALEARRPDSDAADDRYRRYEVPGSSHANRLIYEYAPGSGEMDRIGVAAPAPKCIGADKYGLTDFPFEYLMNAAFANLDAWVRSNIPPPKAKAIETVRGSDMKSLEVKLDKNGNAIGGLRTPYLDVPVATYHSSSKPADERSRDFCGTQGYKVPFDRKKILTLYPTREAYLRRVEEVVDSMVKERFLTSFDGDKIKRDAERVSAW